MSTGAPLHTDAASIVVFDVNETLSDLTPLAARFVDVGLPEHAARTWFAMVLRDGFALTVTGHPRPFAEIAGGVLRVILSGSDSDHEPAEAVTHVMAGFGELGLHPDVAEGVNRLASAGYRLVTLSNGTAEVAERLLAQSGIRDLFERCLTVEDAGAWKPDRAAYLHAGEVCGVEPAEMILAAVHAWDIEGADGAGLRTAWINRSGVPYPDHFAAPSLTVGGLTELAEHLGPAGTLTI